MDIQELKTLVATSTLSPELCDKINALLDAAIARGHATEKEKSQLLALIDLEVEANTIVTSVLSKATAELTTIADSLDTTLDETERQLRSLDDSLTV